MTTFDDDTPPGTSWDEDNYSCAYAAVSVMYLAESQNRWSECTFYLLDY